jgi:hypothetical protein
MHSTELNSLSQFLPLRQLLNHLPPPLLTIHTAFSRLFIDFTRSASANAVTALFRHTPCIPLHRSFDGFIQPMAVEGIPVTPDREIQKEAHNASENVLIRWHAAPQRGNDFYDN